MGISNKMIADYNGKRGKIQERFEMMLKSIKNLRGFENLEGLGHNNNYPAFR
jgi:hypothetical protein